MTRWLLQWTFEIIHAGHIFTFWYAKQFSDELIVALNTNDLIRSYKNREPIDTWENKKTVIEAIRYVDKVIPADNESPMQLILDNKIDIFIVGSEFVEKHKDVIKYMKDNGKKVYVSPRWDWCTSTTAIKEKLLSEYLKQNGHIEVKRLDSDGESKMVQWTDEKQ